MYKSENKKQLTFREFYLPFGGTLDGKNRWVKLAELIPWDEFEEKYELLFKDKISGCPAKPLRLVLGALLIQTKLKITDRETVAQIEENAYMQFFCGFECFQKKMPFDASLMVLFRKRLNAKVIDEINERICVKAVKKNRKAIKEEVPKGTEEHF